MISKINKAAVVSGAMVCIAAISFPAAVKADPPSHLPPPPTAALSCQDPASTLSAADCAHFVEIIRHLDRVSVSTLENLAFLEEIETEIEASVAYQDYLNQDLSEAQSLRMQLALDRTSKFLETLSNIMKKISDTADLINGNIK